MFSGDKFSDLDLSTFMVRNDRIFVYVCRAIKLAVHKSRDLSFLTSFVKVNESLL